MCERVCKAGCIDSRDGLVRFDECVMCMNCLTTCKKDALKLQHMPAVSSPFHADRRTFLKDGAAAVAGLVVGVSGKLLPKTDGADVPPIMPPGAGNRDRFASRCVGCGLCIGACTGNVLKSSVLEYGLRGFQQPVLDPYRGACDFHCTECSRICPCGALVP